MFVSVNDVQLYVEMSGCGKPLVLLHGNGEDHSIFDCLVPELSRTHTVYAIDSRGHGRSSSVEVFDYETMAEDVAEFLKTLAERPVLYGFSDGGIIGLLVASRHPSILEKLIVSGANTSPKGLKWWFRLGLRLSHWRHSDPKLRLMLTQPHITQEELRAIPIPVLVLAGSRDLISRNHTRRLAGSLSHSKLIFLSGETHDSYVCHSSKLLPFLLEWG